VSRDNQSISINKQLIVDFRKAVIWSYRLSRTASSRLLTVITICFLFESLIPAASTATIGILISKLKDASDQNPVGYELVAILLGLAIGLMAVGFLLKEARSFSRQRLIDETGVNLQKRLYQHTARMDLAFFEDSENLNQLSRATSGGGSGAYGPLQSAMSGASGTLKAITLFGLMVYLQPLLAILLLAAGIPLVIVRSLSSIEKYKLAVKTTQRRRLSGYYTSHLAGAGNVPSTKLLNLAGEMIGRFETTARSIIEEKRKILEKITFRLGFAVILFMGVMVTVVGWLIYRFSLGMIEAGAMVAFILAAFRSLGSITQISDSVASGAESALAVIPVFDFLCEEPVISDEGGLIPEALHGGLSLEGVQFTYPKGNSPVIKDLSFTIPPGQKVAIVGRNGAGKSTLIKLISRLYETDVGVIRLDDHDIRELSLRWLHDHIALVFQRPIQFEATAHDNLAFGDWQRLKDNPDEVRTLAEQTGLVDFIKDLPSGFDTHLGRRFGEVTLSGGQWQSLAVARALVRKDSILVLDEPTSNLDVEAEASMFRAIRQFAGHRTVLFVSHKVSTVQEADRILVLDGGQLVEDGTHEELLSQGGYYASMNKRQQKESYLN